MLPSGWGTPESINTLPAGNHTQTMWRCTQHRSFRIDLETCRVNYRRRLSHGIQFHDALHGFRKKRGCGTAILECQLEQEWAMYQAQLLFQVFLDLTKAYDTLDQGRTLLILEQYGVGPNIL